MQNMLPLPLTQLKELDISKTSTIQELGDIYDGKGCESWIAFRPRQRKSWQISVRVQELDDAGESITSLGR